MAEEERHPVAGVRARVRTDPEGEGGGEAGRLARGAIPQRHRLRVRRPAGAVRDALITLVSRQLERVWSEVRVAVEVYLLGEVWALGFGEAEVEGQRVSPRDMDGQHADVETVEAAQDAEAGGTACRHYCCLLAGVVSSIWFVALRVGRMKKDDM